MQDLRVAKKTIREWMNRDHKKQWGSIVGHKQAKSFLHGSTEKKKNLRNYIKIKHEPTEMCDMTTYRMLPLERVFFPNCKR
jgi:hypothetical protein